MASTLSLNMDSLPPIFILPTHIQTDDLHEIEDTLYHAGGRLTYHAAEGRIFIGKTAHKKRAAFDLRTRGVWTVEDSLSPSGPDTKRRKRDNVRDSERDNHWSSDTSDSTATKGSKRRRLTSEQRPQDFPDLTNHIVVLKLEWLEACTKNEAIVPFDDYLVYSGKIIDKPASETQSTPINGGITYIKAIPESQTSMTSREPTANTNSILERAKADAASNQGSSHTVPFHRRKFGQQSTSPVLGQLSHIPKLYRTTTSEADKDGLAKLPPPAPWMTEKHPRPLYSCLRSTPPIETSPNRHFIAQLTKIKDARLLTLDEIGVRAYSTSIASIAAYPHRITTPLEITRLPGCNDKIAGLWVEWYESVTPSNPASPTVISNDNDDNTEKDNGDENDAALDTTRTIPIVRTLESNTDLQHLHTFHQIWGVGAETARKFYLHHGWKDIDDVVEFGWSTLSRSQQIGVKFYDEFQLPIPRAEVESIARTVLQHARLCRDIPPAHWNNDVIEQKAEDEKEDPRDFIAAIVGGYRRGKHASGDVDVILSHRDESLTKDLIVSVVRSLESAGHITHTLTLHTTTSDRDQQTLPYRSSPSGHSSFDTLDKALCVWRDPNTNTTSGESPHRRVDIIISPWRTVGCAVLGWSGGTTFQRDIRRWVKRERGWKFDSSGVRERGSGRVLDLEGDENGGWRAREKIVMERLGIGWREARERCTG